MYIDILSTPHCMYTELVNYSMIYNPLNHVIQLICGNFTILFETIISNCQHNLF